MRQGDDMSLSGDEPEDNKRGLTSSWRNKVVFALIHFFSAFGDGFKDIEDFLWELVEVEG